MDPAKIIKPVLMEDPILDVQSVKYQETNIGGQNITYKTENASSYSSSAASFSFYTPNQNTMLSRRILLRMRLRVDLTSAGATGNLYKPDKMGWKQFPISSIINTMQLTLNNSNTTINLADVVHPFSLYQDEDEIKECFSTTPSMRDYFQKYSQGTGTNRSPYAKYSDNVAYPSRSTFAPVAVLVPNSSTAYRADYEFVVPLMISPLQFDNMDSNQGLLYVKSVSLNLNFVGNLAQRAWGISDELTGNEAPTVSVTLADVPSLLLKYVTPQSGQVKYPERSVYNYANVERFISNNNGADVVSGNTFKLTSDNLQLNSIPHAIMVWAKRDDSTISHTTTDTFFAIEDVSIQFANQSGLLSTATQQDLYNMSKKNGLRCSYPEFKGETIDQTGASVGLTGSVLCMKPGYDLPLQQGVVPGTVQTNNFQITVTVKNVHPTDDIAPRLYIATINQGILVSGKDGLVSQYTSSISPSVLKESVKGKKYGVRSDQKKLFGGLFVVSPKSLFRLGRHAVSGAVKAASGNIPGALMEIPGAIADDIKFVDEDAKSLSKLLKKVGAKGGKVKKAKKAQGGSSLLGGKKYTQKDILKRLMNA